VVPVAADGLAVFRKLRIMEVSSKHRHQAFSLLFQLQTIPSREHLEEGRRSDDSPDGKLRPKEDFQSLGDPVKSTALHVQSRMPSRKNSVDESAAISSSDPNARPKKRARSDSDCNYVDITPLLILPQKEAAQRLGISESMLCKRFKECTRRKWPYRYIRKIEKMIRVLTVNKKTDGIPKEDQEKIQKLKQEKEECLRPVKIRITGSDKIQSMATKGSATNRKEKDDGMYDSDMDSDNEYYKNNISDDDLGNGSEDETMTTLEQPINVDTNTPQVAAPESTLPVRDLFVSPISRTSPPSAFLPVQMLPQIPLPQITQQTSPQMRRISFLLNTDSYQNECNFNNTEVPQAAAANHEDLRDVAATLNLLRSGSP